MADPYAPNEDWQEGYQDGYDTGFFDGMKQGRVQSMNMRTSKSAGRRITPQMFNAQVASKTKRKVPQKGKAKILTTMTKPIWDKYKKGNGKKTYVTIRAQVSRSQAYKKKVKGMK